MNDPKYKTNSGTMFDVAMALIAIAAIVVYLLYIPSAENQNEENQKEEPQKVRTFTITERAEEDTHIEGIELGYFDFWKVEV